MNGHPSTATAPLQRTPPKLGGAVTASASSPFMDTPSKVQAKRGTPQTSPSKPGPTLKQNTGANHRVGADSGLGDSVSGAVRSMQSGLSLLNGSSDFEPGPLSVWGGDGDDMSMELLTDVDDEGNVDEEVRRIFLCWYQPAPRQY